MKPLHIIHIVHSFGIGGLENGIVNLANRMDPARFTVSIVSLTKKLDSSTRITRKNVKCVVFEKKSGNDWALPFKLAEFLRKEQGDIIHTHGWGTYLEGLSAAKLARIPIVIHGEHGTDQFDLARRRIAYRAGAFGIRMFLTVSDNMRDRFIGKYNIPREKIRTIRNGVDTTFFIADQELRQGTRRELGFADHDVVIGSIGRLCYEKNYETLLRAVALVRQKNRQCHLILVGDGPERSRLTGLISELGLQNCVRLLGMRDDRLELLNAMDVFALSSLSEGLPNTLLEAMSVGLPVVSTNVGGIPEVVASHEQGFLVNPQDPEAFAGALESLLASQELRVRSGVFAKQRILSSFTLEVMVREYENMYSENANNLITKESKFFCNDNANENRFSQNNGLLTSRSPSFNIYSSILKTCFLPLVSIFTKSKFWEICGDLRNGNPPKVFCPKNEEVLKKIQELVAHAYKEVPFYRERLQQHEILPEDLITFDSVKRLPPITKENIKANFPDRMTASSKLYKPWRYKSTSGTIERLTVIQDFRKRDLDRAVQLLSLNIPTGYEPGMRYMEIPPNICATVCGAFDVMEPPLLEFIWASFCRRELFNSEALSDIRGLIDRQVLYRRLQLPSFGSGLTQKEDSLAYYLDEIDRYHPYVLKALPVYLYLLALHICERRLSPPRIPGGLMPMGSSLTPYMKRVIETAFQTPVHENYGCAELGAIAIECGLQKGLHPLSSLFYVEIIHKGRPARPGELGKILITDLYNYAMPFIRYDIGDVALVLPGSCECGIPGDRFEVKGRLQDCLVAETGELVTSDQLVDCLLQRKDILGFQIESYQQGELNLQIAPRHGERANIEEIREALAHLLGKEWKILVRVVPTILPEPSGKYRFVKNHVDFPEELF